MRERNSERERVCVCVCVCERERERDRERERGKMTNLGVKIVGGDIGGIEEAKCVLDEVVLHRAELERDVPVLGAFVEPDGGSQRFLGGGNGVVDVDPEPDGPGRKDPELNAIDVIIFVRTVMKTK